MLKKKGYKFTMGTPAIYTSEPGHWVGVQGRFNCSDILPEDYVYLHDGVCNICAERVPFARWLWGFSRESDELLHVATGVMGDIWCSGMGKYRYVPFIHTREMFGSRDLTVALISSLRHWIFGVTIILIGASG